jgi:hypothetical protein
MASMTMARIRSRSGSSGRAPFTSPSIVVKESTLALRRSAKRLTRSARDPSSSCPEGATRSEKSPSDMRSTALSTRRTFESIERVTRRTPAKAAAVTMALTRA